MQKQDKYPESFVDAYSLLVHWKQNPCNIMQLLGPSNDGVAFTTTEDMNERHRSTGNKKGKKRAQHCALCSLFFGESNIFMTVDPFVTNKGSVA
jgi:hypothetical protein